MFRRSNAFDIVGEECRAVREAVGLNEIHNFSKFEITGPNAESWLNHILANRMPKPGRMTLSPLLNPNGKLIDDLTVYHMSPGRFQVVGYYAAQAYHMRCFLAQFPSGGAGGVNIKKFSPMPASVSRSPGLSHGICWDGSPIKTSQQMPSRFLASGKWPWGMSRPSSTASPTPVI